MSESHDFSTATVRHRQLRSDQLGPARFYELYTGFFESNNRDLWGREEDFTEFRCRTRFVDHGGRVFKTAFCVRRYRKLDGLYDAVFKAAALGDPAAGFETALVLSAVSFENAERLAHQYFRGISWSE